MPYPIVSGDQQQCSIGNGRTVTPHSVEHLLTYIVYEHECMIGNYTPRHNVQPSKTLPGVSTMVIRFVADVDTSLVRMV